MEARILHFNITWILTIWYLPRILHDSNTCYEYSIIPRFLQGLWFHTLLLWWRLWPKIYRNLKWMLYNQKTPSFSRWVSRKVKGRKVFTAKLWCIHVFIIEISHESAFVRATHLISNVVAFLDQVTAHYIWGFNILNKTKYRFELCRNVLAGVLVTRRTSDGSPKSASKRYHNQ